MNSFTLRSNLCSKNVVLILIKSEIMKYVILFAVFLCGSTLFSQVIVDSPLYDSLKVLNQLSNVELVYDSTTTNSISPIISPSTNEKSGACDCYVEPDASYTLALAPNDDGSSNLINIPFNFCMYGQTYNQIYINNNGNITFTGPMATFSATAFPSGGNNPIIAPFWGDVDTRGGFGQVLYKITPTAVFVNWKDVGYFSIHGDKLNSFQLIITDGTDPVISSGNVAFCYKDMQWTTGDASNGVNGFGGVPATAGTNKGDNISFFLISRFDHAGNDFDGALGNADGISWLDYKSFYFDVCNIGNVPPIAEGISACDTFKICALGDTADISINFLSPETTQSTSITYSNGGLTSLQEVGNISGNTASIILRAVGDLTSIGSWNVTVTATDDATPTPGVTTISFVIQIDTVGLSNLNPQLTPLEACDSLSISVLNGPYDSYLWDDFSTGSTNFLDSAQNFGVTVSLNGCYKRIEEYFTIAEPFSINLVGNYSICSPDTVSEMYLPDSLSYGNVTWGLQDPGLDSLFSAYLSANTYTITVQDSLFLCTDDTTFTINYNQPPLIFEDTFACDFQFNVFGTFAVSGGVWSSPDTNIRFLPNETALNPTITSSIPGTFTVNFIDNTCGIELSSTIFFENWAWTSLPDTILCEGSSFVINAYNPPQNDDYLWSTGSTETTIYVSSPGVYYLTVSNECNSYTDSAIVGIKVCDILAPNIIVLSSTQGNNEFVINYSGVKEYRITIQNRWGNNIWESTNPADYWKGKTSNGNIVEEGVYFYTIKAVLDNDEELEKQGFVHVYH